MEKIDNKIISSEAARVALIFGAISGGYIFVSGALGHMNSAVASNLISIVLWVAKFVGCIVLMRFFMKRLQSSYEGVTRGSLISFGSYIALFSAIITAACSYISVQYVFPEQISQAFDMMFQQYSSMLDSNSMAALEQMEGKMGIITMSSQLIWCFLYGWILSSILANNLAGKKDIFDDDDI